MSVVNLLIVIFFVIQSLIQSYSINAFTKKVQLKDREHFSLE